MSKCLHACMWYTIYMSVVHGGQKKTSDLLKLQSWKVVRSHMEAGI